MTILCVIASLGSGGAQRQMIELALGFKAQGHSVAFLTYHDEIFFNAILFQNNIQVTCIREPNYLKRLLKMRRFIRRGGYDAVLSFLRASGFICEISGLPFRKWKLVVGERSANPNIKTSLKLKTYQWFHLLADYVVANSHSNIKIVHSINPLLSLNKCKVIYNIVDLETWKPEVAHMPKKNGNINLVVAANHAYYKNLNCLVEAVNLLSSAEKARLKIEWYGDSIEEPYIDSSIKEARAKIQQYKIDSIFHFYPATHNLTEVFQKCDAIGLFSQFEGLPNVVCEGMACGKTVICTAISDLPILLKHQSDLLCKPSDSESLKKALSYLLALHDKELHEIGKENRMIAQKYFDKKDKILQYLSLMS